MYTNSLFYIAVIFLIFAATGCQSHSSTEIKTASAPTLFTLLPASQTHVAFNNNLVEQIVLQVQLSVVIIPGDKKNVYKDNLQL